MGEVLLGRRRGAHGFERLVAIKTIRDELSGTASMRAMFLDEAMVTARITHPTVVNIHDFGEDGDVLYLVMEYVPGISFRDLIARRPPVKVSVAAMAQVCRGLHAAHEVVGADGRPLHVV